MYEPGLSAWSTNVSRAEKGRAVKRAVRSWAQLLGPTLGPMCDAEKDWHEHSFCASGAINGGQKSPLDKPEMTFSFFIFKLPVTSF